MKEKNIYTYNGLLFNWSVSINIERILRNNKDFSGNTTLEYYLYKLHIVHVSYFTNK